MQALFGVKDYNLTYNNHKSRMPKLENIAYEDVIDEYADENILSTIYNSNFYRYGFWKEEKSEKRKKRMLARMVNQATWDYIARVLTDEGLSKYYATAFYIKHYEAINKFMEEEVLASL